MALQKKRYKRSKNRRSKNRRKRRLKKFYVAPSPKITGIFIVLVLISLATASGVKHLMYKTEIFKVEKVEITGTNYLDPVEIMNLADIELNKPLFRVNVDSVVSRVMKNKYVRAVSVSRNIPSTLIIDVREIQPALFLLDKIIYMVDDNGMILKNLPGINTEGLPFVTGAGVAGLLKDRTPLLRALDLMNKIREVDETLISYISEVNLKGGGWPVLYLMEGGAKVILGDTGHYQRIYYWSELFRQTDITSKLSKIKELDFTFSDRVAIEYKKSKG